MTTFTIQQTKSGGIALVFSPQQRIQAYQFAAMIEAKMTEALSTFEPKKKTLADVRQAVEYGAKGNATLSLNTSPVKVPSAKSIKHVDKERQANEILGVMSEKLKEVHGKFTPSMLRPFYTDIENEMGIGLTVYHRGIRSRVKDASKYPNRKIDSLLSIAEPDVILEYAKNYEV